MKLGIYRYIYMYIERHPKFSVSDLAGAFTSTVKVTPAPFSLGP